MREASLERYACEKIVRAGGRAFKWACPGASGVPDRICIFPGGRIVFIEFKRPGRAGGLSARQKKICRLLEGLGCEVRRIGEKEDLRKVMAEFGIAAGGVK
jgi:hypothetical protein